VPQSSQRAPVPAEGLGSAFRATRRLSEALAEPLSEADAALQSMEDASPAKWHLAHTTWFWETFLLRDHLPGYRLWREEWPYLFNSYYEAEGARLPRARRGMLSRPSLGEVLDWRAHVTEVMAPLLGDPALAPLVTLGIAHEQQHQELLLTDSKHALFQNPLGPAMWPASNAPAPSPPSADGWSSHPGGMALVGHDGAGFAFDNEAPRHRVLLEPFALAERLVTNAEWQQFIDDGGYRTASLWLSDGWAWRQAEVIEAPLYWRGGEHFTHCGWQPRDPAAPVAHISYF
jgi:ergothioneine biosynthesis protein EgtB